jgi:hypothetical protein
VGVMLSKLFLGKLFLNLSATSVSAANTQSGNRNATNKRVAVSFFTVCLLQKNVAQYKFNLIPCLVKNYLCCLDV